MSLKYIVHLTDTQIISSAYPWFYPQIFDYIKALPDAGVFFTGDIVQPGTVPEASQLSAFAKFYNNLTNCGIPFIVGMGNHDYVDGRTDRLTNINNYLTAQSWLTTRESGRIENSWGEIDIGNQHYLILALEYAPRANTVVWADYILTDFEQRCPEGKVILLTHVWLYKDGNRYDWATYGTSQQYSPHVYPCLFTQNEGTNDGQDLYNSLVLQHPSIRIVLGGHIGAAYRIDTPNGNVVYQSIGDYSGISRSAWMQVYEFNSTGFTVRTVSPVIKRFAKWANSKFSVNL
jgi:hypothetical protein